MMDTMLIELTNEKAAGLLHELEQLHLIKVLEKKDKGGKKLSEKYSGKLPSDVTDKLQEHITQSRNEWDNRI